MNFTRVSLLIFSICVCSSYSQTFVQISSDAQFKAALNNPRYVGTIVSYMTTTCTHSKYIRV